MVLKIGDTVDTIECDKLIVTTAENQDNEELCEWTLLTKQSIGSSVANIEFDVSAYTDGTWEQIKIVGHEITTVTDNANLGLYASTNSGSSYFTSYRNVIGRSTDGASTWTYSYNATRSNMEIMQGTGNAAWERHYMEAILYCGATPSADTTLSTVCHWWANDTAPNQGFSSSTFTNSAVAVTTIKLQASSGNIDGGSFRIYGRNIT